MTLLAEVARTSADVAALPGRLAKTDRIATLLRSLPPEEVDIAVAWLSGQPRQKRMGVGWVTVNASLDLPFAEAPTLTIAEVDSTFTELEATTGPGSKQRKEGILRELLSRTTEAERDFLARLLLGELRQGALENLVVEALAKASGADVKAIRRSVMLRGRAGDVGRAVLEGGDGGMASDTIQLFRPIKPMLASPAGTIEDALESFGGTAALEYKLDGWRIQVHKQGDEVRAYTRRQNEETGIPEIIDRVRLLPCDSVILDGEAIALDTGGRPRHFQETMRRFGRKLDVEAVRADVPLTGFFFDVLYLNGESLIDLPAADRFAKLDDLVPPDMRAPRILVSDADEARAFSDTVLEKGHEGIMAKDLRSTYQAGRRGKSWLKLKPAITLDCVVLGAEWGHGRRQGWLSNLHLGVRGDSPGELVMVGKTFKGMTDELLRWQTEALQRIAIGKVPGGVLVRPELVVEIAFEGVLASPRYAGGLALRFARVKGYRPDKSTSEADSIQALREVLRRSGGRSATE
jgi:DNA ligase 1